MLTFGYTTFLFSLARYNKPYVYNFFSIILICKLYFLNFLNRSKILIKNILNGKRLIFTCTCLLTKMVYDVFTAYAHIM